MAEASAQTASGESLAEVVIAAERKAAGVIALFGVEAGADGGERGGEGPAAEEGGNAVFRNREEEFVIFAAGEGESGRGVRGEGDLIGVDGEPNAGDAGEAGEIGSEPITEIEHGGGKSMANEPLTFGEARGEGEMVMGPRAAEFSGDEKEVAGLGAGAGGRGFFGDGAEKRDGEKELGGTDSFATDDGETKFFCEARESTVGLKDTGSGAGVGAADGEEGGTGSGAGGGEIAEGPGEGFAAEEGGGGRAGKVEAFDDGVSFENEVEVFGKGGKDGAVVSEGVTDAGGGLRAERGEPALHPKIFAGEGKFFHGRGGRARRMRRQVLALKRE